MPCRPDADHDGVRSQQFPPSRGETDGPTDASGARMTDIDAPRARLPFTRLGLIRINLYWLALSGLWAAIAIQLAPVIGTHLVCPTGTDGAACALLPLGQLTPLVGDVRLRPEVALGFMGLVGAVVAFVVQPISAALSDSTRTPVRSSSALDPGRHHPRRGVPARPLHVADVPGIRDPGLAAPALEQPGPGAVPGLRAGHGPRAPGGRRIGAGGRDADRGSAGGCRHRRPGRLAGGPAAGLHRSRRPARLARCCPACCASTTTRWTCPHERVPGSLAPGRRWRRHGRTGASSGCW